MTTFVEKQVAQVLQTRTVQMDEVHANLELWKPAFQKEHDNLVRGPVTPISGQEYEQLKKEGVPMETLAMKGSDCRLRKLYRAADGGRGVGGWCVSYDDARHGSLGCPYSRMEFGKLGCDWCVLAGTEEGDWRHVHCGATSDLEGHGHHSPRRTVLCMDSLRG